MTSEATTAAARIEIVIDGEETPTGEIRPESGSGYAFSGWIELAGAIERWRGAERVRLEGGPKDRDER